MTATGFYFDGASWTHKTNPYDQARWTTAMAWCKKSENLALKCTTNWNFSDSTQPNWILFPSGEKNPEHIRDELEQNITQEKYHLFSDHVKETMFNFSVANMKTTT